ncbi:DUF5704 domain-containing protein, partial [Paenibacillus monticola]
MNVKDKVIRVTLVLSILFIGLAMLFAVSTKAATESLYTTAGVQYTPNDSNLRRDHESVFYKEKTITTKPFSIDAGTGKIITKIVLKKDGQALQTITVNARTYNQSITLHGEPVPVKSVDNVGNGSWFAWQRSIAGTHWEAFPTELGWSDIGDSTTGSETIGGITKDKWPGQIVKMEVAYYRYEAFYSIGGVDYGSFATTYIDSTTDTLNDTNPFQPGVNVRTINDAEILAPNSSGTTDSTTVITGLTIPDLSKASITFTQKHDHEGSRVELGGNGAAAMMYYFANYKFDIKSYTYRYPNVYEVYVRDDDGVIPSPPPTTPPGGDVVCSNPSPGQSISGGFMTPTVTAEIRADQRGNEQFDVLQGIPTSESLYGHAASQNYLFQNTFVQMSGTCSYNIEIQKTYTLTWDPQKDVPDAEGMGTHKEPDPKSETETKTYNYTIERPYSYWTLNNLEIYKLSSATLRNDTLPGGSVALLPNGYTAPNYSTEISGKLIPPVAPAGITAPAGTKSGTTTRPVPDNDMGALRPLAEQAAKKVEVQNDTLTFGGQTIMDGRIATEVGPTPGTIPVPQPIGDQVLYQAGNTIERTHPNKRNIPSSGELHYGLMAGNINGGTADQQFSINGINTITVHTPVVNYSVLPDDNRPFDQRMIPDMTRTVLIL